MTLVAKSAKVTGSKNKEGFHMAKTVNYGYSYYRYYEYSGDIACP